jgi:hypothetical protein
MKTWILIIALFQFSVLGFSQDEVGESCARTAVVNYQEILVDTNTTNKGEGLRYYLEKDPVAKNYLEKYQSSGRPQKLIAGVGALGSSMLLASLYTPKKKGVSGLQTRDILVIGGVVTLLTNFLIARTYDYNNEAYLEKAIDEYNKRNLPRIYFGPTLDDARQARNSKRKFGINAGVVASF